MRTVRRILVATDFSRTADAALDEAVALARPLDASLDLIHAREPLLEALTRDSAEDDGAVAGRVAKIDDDLSAPAERVIGAGVPCGNTAIDGMPAATIPDHAAKTGVDLIAVGRVGPSSVGYLLHGDVSRRIVENAPCGVLVVPRVG